MYRSFVRLISTENALRTPTVAWLSISNSKEGPKIYVLQIGLNPMVMVSPKIPAEWIN